jgi:hypothetical protein
VANSSGHDWDNINSRLDVRFSVLREELNATVIPEPTHRGAFLEFPIAGGKTYHAALRWERVRYIAKNKVRLEALASDKFPDDWPE